MSSPHTICRQLGARLRGHDKSGSLQKIRAFSQNRFVQVVPVWIHFFDQPQLRGDCHAADGNLRFRCSQAKITPLEETRHDRIGALSLLECRICLRHASRNNVVRKNHRLMWAISDLNDHRHGGMTAL